MDKRLQQIFKAIVLLFLMLFMESFASAQCTDSILVYSKNGCERVSITKALFVDLFVSKSTLDTVHADLVFLETKLDSMRTAEAELVREKKRIELSLQKEIRERESKDSLHQLSQVLAKQSLSDLNKEYEALQKTVGRLQSQKKVIVVGCLSGGSALTLLILTAVKFWVPH